MQTTWQHCIAKMTHDVIITSYLAPGSFEVGSREDWHLSLGTAHDD
jgi:hypothetical protein